MVVMHRKTIRAYGAADPRAKEALDVWYLKVVAASWANPSDVRRTMGYTDQIGDERFIFNIKGNHYRLLAAVNFARRTIYIKGIFTHAEYDDLSKHDLLTLEHKK